MKALLLDLDDTLVDERHAVRQAFSALLDMHRAFLPDLPEEALLASWREITLRHWLRYERGEISFQDQRRDRLREFLDRPFTDAEADAAVAIYPATYLSSMRLFAEVPDFLARTGGMPRIVVTNGETELQRRKLELTGLSGHVTAMVTPMECHSWKPDPGIFLAAAARLGVEAGQCAMIGDNEAMDIRPARDLGMAAFRVAAGDPERTLLKALDHLRL